MKHYEAKEGALNYESLFIAGAGGKLGKDLGNLAALHALDVTTEPEAATFVALCTPSYVAQEIFHNGTYKDKTVIDLSGAAKRNGSGQYGLMRSESLPWDKSFDSDCRVYGNPGCIASAVILGLCAAGLEGSSLPEEVSVVSVGGRSHAPDSKQDSLTIANRTFHHPHVGEIENALGSCVRVSHFTPIIADVPEGLLVTVSGKTILSRFNMGSERLCTDKVVGTDKLLHKLELHPHPDSPNADFSLGVCIDNVRFVTANALNLMRYIAQMRKRY